MQAASKALCVKEFIHAGRDVYGAMLNLVVWNKTNAGQGSFYRSQHELIAVFRVGDEKQRNNIQLGRFGRSRSNVWTYAGVNTFAKGRTVSVFRPNATVFVQESPADAVFFIRKGQIKITVASKQGKEAVIAIMGPGDFFGEGSLIGQPLRLATARAMTESEVLRLGKTEMMRVLHAETSFSELFITYLLTRNSRVEADLIDQFFSSSEKRLARKLLMLANFGKEAGPQPIMIKISQETLAEIIGTAPE